MNINVIFYKKIIILLVINYLKSNVLCSFRCDRRPYGTTNLATHPDGRFRLLIEDIEENSYIPDQLYTVKIKAMDGNSLFSGFMVSVEGDLKPDPLNPRRLLQLSPGVIRPQNQLTSRFSDRCLYSVEQSDLSLKSLIEVYWQAPAPGNGCVTMRAMVAENEVSWYQDGGPLAKKLCEDTRQPDDVALRLNYDCKACDEAKYEISFTGIWSRNTHPNLYPENDWIPRYSDLVGASHSAEFILWSPGSLASNGLKDLAEHANTTLFESEIREKIGDGIRTMIKGKGHGYRKMSNPSYSFFRVDKVNHLVTAAVGLYPSPDWFLGITRFELCQDDNTWLNERELNLYPWDAGTDNGVSYESANIETFPQDAVTRVQMSSYDKNSPFYETDMKDLHPFGRIRVKLVRTYHRECEEQTDEGETPGNDEEKEKQPQTMEPDEPSRYQNPEIDSSGKGGETPIQVDPDSPEECPMTPWEEWSACEGPCVDGLVTGFKWRQRYHLVDDMPLEKYNPNVRTLAKKLPDSCKADEIFERSECSGSCFDDNSNIMAERQRGLDPVAPGHSWISKKRDLPPKESRINSESQITISKYLSN